MTSTTNIPFDQPKPDREPADRRTGSGPRPRARVSLSAGLAGHRNSLGVIRLVLACAVIFSHAFPVGGWGSDPLAALSNNQETIGGFAVAGFFAVSGYLIAKSGASADILQFMWRRALRIFPAFWTVLVIGAFVVGPIAWRLSGNSLRSYLGFEPLRYVVANADLLMRQYGIYDIFGTTTPYGRSLNGASVFNGSLWTLVYEWSCYLLIAVLLVTGALRRAKWIVPSLAGVFYVLLIVDTVSPLEVAAWAPYFDDRFKITLTLVFLFGATLAMYSKRIPLNDWAGAACGIVMVVTLFTGGWFFLGYPAYAYFVLWLAARLPRGLQRIGSKTDYSYGMYVYGFLVQQFTAFLGWHLFGYWAWVALTLVLTAACAWLSWHLVEKRAMALKDWGPGRGLRFLSPGGRLVRSNVDATQREDSRP